MSALREEVVGAQFARMPCDKIFLYDLCSILLFFSNMVALEMRI